LEAECAKPHSALVRKVEVLPIMLWSAAKLHSMKPETAPRMSAEFIVGKLKLNA
jgi:hypothetical protein